MSIVLKNLSGNEFGLLLFHVDQLSYNEARLLEAELRETYRQSLDNWYAPEPSIRDQDQKNRVNRHEELGRRARNKYKLVK
jgi:hypothetical protein